MREAGRFVSTSRRMPARHRMVRNSRFRCSARLARTIWTSTEELTELDQTGAWSLGDFPFHSSRTISACYRLRQRGRAEDEVDAHSAVRREPQLGVVPVGADPRPWRERPYQVGILHIADRTERGSISFGDVRAALIGLDASYILVGGCDVPVTGQCDLRDQRRRFTSGSLLSPGREGG